MIYVRQESEDAYTALHLVRTKKEGRSWTTLLKFEFGMESNDRLALAGSAVRARPDRSAGVKVQNKRLQHPVPLPQDQVGRQRQDRRRHAQVLHQRGRLPHAGAFVSLRGF